MALQRAALVSVGCLIALLAGCKSTRPGDTVVQTPGQRIELQGCKADSISVWDNNATISTGQHVVRVDEYYITVDGKIAPRRPFKNMVISCDADGDIAVSIDGKSIEDLASK